MLDETTCRDAASRPQVAITSGGNDDSCQEALHSGEFHLPPKPYQLYDLIRIATRLQKQKTILQNEGLASFKRPKRHRPSRSGEQSGAKELRLN